MSRAWVVALAVILAVAGPGAAQVCTDDLGFGVTFGILQPSGGDEEYEDAGLIAGLQVKKLMNDRVSVVFDYRRGVSGCGECSTAEPASLGPRVTGWGEPDDFRTVWNHAGLSAVYNLMPEGRVVPFLSGGLGITFWEVQDYWDETSEDGTVPEGYDTDGKLRKLEGANLTAVVGAGAELFASERLAITIGGRYYYLFQNDLDNVGWSSAYGPDYVDANSSLLEGYIGLTYYFGAGDCDGDGIIGKKDKCWRDPEDFDGFEDEDGCPDPDNDGDGFLDAVDACPDEPEDFDGDADDDGCPDIDMDGDGIIDEVDACPEVPEDLDGFRDDDGCPDPDNDGDGVLDASDKCPDTAAGVEVDEDGCPKPERRAELVAVMVFFELASSELSDQEMRKLDALAEALVEDPEYTVDIAGHACDLGTTEYNQKLSEERAEAVKAYLVSKGVDGSRMTVVGYGEMMPLVPNDSEAQRRQNRRAMITPSRP